MLWPRLRLGSRMSMLATSSFWVRISLIISEANKGMGMMPFPSKLGCHSPSVAGRHRARFTQHTLQTYFADALLEKISKEIRSTDMLWERVVASCLDELLTKVVRFSKQDFVLSIPDHSQRVERFKDRAMRFSKPWTIGQMAMMGLSAGKFASLYKQEFTLQALPKI